MRSNLGKIMYAGDFDMTRAIAELAAFLPESLQPLARIAYDYRWSWSVDGAAMFEAIDPERWEHTGHNPRRLLTETHPNFRIYPKIFGYFR